MIEQNPRDVAAVTVEWLQHRLAANGVKARIKSFEIAPVGAGLMAITSRLTFDFAEADEHAPRSLIFKSTSNSAVARKMGKQGAGFVGRPGFYAAEVQFYAEFSARLAIRTPKLYAAWISDDEDEFTLLLEDISAARSGDELYGCTLAEATQAMVSIAGLHAPFWNSELFEHPGLLARPTKIWADRAQLNMDRAAIRYQERHEAGIAEEDSVLVRQFIPHYGEWFYAAGKNMSLTHNDFRLDNMLFTDAGECVTVDWQTFATGHNGRDIGLFLGCSVPTEIRRAHEILLLRAYHDRMIELGVHNYAFDECVDDFRYGVFLGMQNIVIGMSAVSLTDRGTAMFRTKLTRCCATIRDHNAMSLIGA